MGLIWDSHLVFEGREIKLEDLKGNYYKLF